MQLIALGKVNSTWIKGWCALNLIRRALPIEEGLSHSTPEQAQAACTGLNVQRGLQALLCHLHPLTAG